MFARNKYYHHRHYCCYCKHVNCHRRANTHTKRRNRQTTGTEESTNLRTGLGRSSFTPSATAVRTTCYTGESEAYGWSHQNLRWTPKNHVLPYVDTPYVVLITLFMIPRKIVEGLNCCPVQLTVPPNSTKWFDTLLCTRQEGTNARPMVD